jgi:hypothetical protein
MKMTTVYSTNRKGWMNMVIKNGKVKMADSWRRAKDRVNRCKSHYWFIQQYNISPHFLYWALPITPALINFFRLLSILKVTGLCYNSRSCQRVVSVTTSLFFNSMILVILLNTHHRHFKSSLRKRTVLNCARSHTVHAPSYISSSLTNYVLFRGSFGAGRPSWRQPINHDSLGKPHFYISLCCSCNLIQVMPPIRNSL